MTNKEKSFKRCFDILVSAIGLLFTFPLIILAWLVASLETRSNGFFVQGRIGQEGKIINVIKIKTMKNFTGTRSSVTSETLSAITNSGAFFRQYKIDELPQLWNVLIGDMSFVGPRPDVPGYADQLVGGDRIILTIRPGITGPASLKYKNEEEILNQQVQPKEYNDTVIWPDKVQLNKQYIEDYTFISDINYIIKTVRG